MKYLVPNLCFVILALLGNLGLIASEAQEPCHLDLPLVFIPEMDELPFRLGSDSATLASVQSPTHWNSSIQSVIPYASAKVASGAWKRMARWAKSQTQSFHLRPDWAVNLPFEPLGFGASGTIVFGQLNVCDGFPLPSHSPLVFHRLLLFIELDQNTAELAKLFVTIRGWREE